MNLLLWLPIIAAVLGLLVHSFSDDGGASLLAHFGLAWRLPAASVPIATLVFGVASGTVDAVVAGSDWQHAAATAVLTAIGTLAGATVQHGLVNKTSTAAGVLIFVGFMRCLTACASTPSAAQQAAVVEDGVEQRACVENAPKGVGKAALQAAIDKCRDDVKAKRAAGGAS